jgi:NitT/TauT family transport system substrate-binding protein
MAGLLGAAVLAAAPAVAADKISVGLSAVYPPYSIPYAAQELGLYKEAGIDVELTLFRGNSPAQEALVAGLADIITAPPHAAALAIVKGAKERVVGFPGDLFPTGWYVLVRKDSPIKTMADLSGKSIGMGSKGSATDLMALLAMTQSKVTAQTIPLGNPGVMPALRARQVDAAVSWPLVSYKALNSGDYRAIFDFAQMRDPLVMNAWVASTAMVDKRPDVLRRWLKANHKAVDYMQSHEDWTLKFLQRYTEDDDAQAIKAAYDESIKHLVADQKVTVEWLQSELALASRLWAIGLPDAGQIYANMFEPAGAADK